MIVQNCLSIYSALTPELFRAFLEHTPVAVAMFDRQMRYLLTSRQWLLDYGLDNQDIINRSYYEVFPNLPHHWHELHQRCLAGGVERCDNDRFVRPDGGVEWVKWEVHPWRHPTGEIGGLIMFTEFITPAEPRQEALSELMVELESRSEAIAQDSTKQSVSDINMEWHLTWNSCPLENHPIVMMWIDTTLARLMAALQALLGDKRFSLILQREGRQSVESDWPVIPQFADFREGFAAIARVARAGGWGNWQLLCVDREHKECRLRISNSWEGLYQKTLGVCWGSKMLAGKLEGYCSKLFGTNCWAEQTTFIARGDDFDEFVVRSSEGSIAVEIDTLLGCDDAICNELAGAWQNLQRDIADALCDRCASHQRHTNFMKQCST